jgi:hypothetical protein
MSSVSNLTELRALLSALPREELKTLNKEIREMIASAPKEKKEKKAKRPAAVGQKAWFAFMAQCRATLPERFTAGMKAPEMAVVCKAIRQEDEAVYTAFVEKFKADNTPEKSPDNSAPASDVSDSEGPCDEAPAEEAPAEEAPTEEAPISDAEAPVSATKPAKRVRLSPEQKAAKEATQSAEKEAKKAEKARAKAAKEAEEAEEKEKKALAKALAKADAKVAKEAAKAEAKAAKEGAKAAKATKA